MLRTSMAPPHPSLTVTRFATAWPQYSLFELAVPGHAVPAGYALNQLPPDRLTPVKVRTTATALPGTLLTPPIGTRIVLPSTPANPYPSRVSQNRSGSTGTK